MQTIDARKVRDLINMKDAAILVDTLPQETYEKAHIPGAHSVPAKSEDFIERVDDLVDSRNQTVIVYCANEECDLSPTAARKLEDAGYANVLDFEGGIEAWREAGYELVEEKG